MGAKKPVELVQTDVVGPMECFSMGKAKSFLKLLNDYTESYKVRFLNMKSEAASKSNRDILRNRKLILFKG